MPCLFSILEHIKCNITVIIVVLLEIIQFYFSIFEPFFTFIEHCIIYWFKIFKFSINIFQIFCQNCIYCLLLNFKSSSHIWKLLSNFTFELLAFFCKFLENCINLLFIWFFSHRLFDNLEHFHKTFSS